MLTDLRLRGFKAAFDSTKIELRPLTAFIGRNGSGKSSILESLQWLQDCAARGLDAATNERFDSFEALCNRRTDEIDLSLGWAGGRRGLPVRYDLAVIAGKHGAPIVRSERCVEGRGRAARPTITSRKGARGPAVRRVRGAGAVRDGDALALADTVRSRAHGAERLYDFIRGAVFLRLSPTALARHGPLRLPSRGPVIDEEGAGLPAVIRSLSTQQLKNVLLRVQRTLPSVEAIRVFKSPEEKRGIMGLVERMTARGGSRSFDVPSWMLSEGTRRIVAIYSLLAMEPAPSLIALEEIENGLDPWTLGHVMDALREGAERGIQILLTTHSPYLLDRLTSEEVVHVAREKGNSLYRPLRSFPEVEKNEGRIPPGIMYVANYMGSARPAEAE